MTWKEFKDTVEAQGVTDETEIDYIDISYPLNIRVEIDEDGAAGIM